MTEKNGDYGPGETYWPKVFAPTAATDTKRVLDSVRDLMATAIKICEDRDNLLGGERAADRHIENLHAKLEEVTHERDCLAGDVVVWKNRALISASPGQAAEWMHDE